MATEFEKQFVNDIKRAHVHVAWVGDESSDVHVVIWPTWSGLSDFEKSFAEEVVSWGHTATAVDLYGVGNNPTELQDKADTMMALVAEKGPLTALQSDICQEIAESHPNKKLVHVGFCLGGRLAIEAGLHIPSSKGAASFHGLMNFYRPESSEDANREAKFIIFNGYQDPMVDVAAADQARADLDDMGLDWQFVDFGQTKHSFMLPSANAPQDGHAFSAAASARGRNALRFFLSELAS
ncbi:Dienelactone hydrolase family protein [Marinomonas aquimarina]|uniref:Dienelactone hydrolase family protein n=1 Tax=Marinomonas aquimarina TaxID=295068 RepID=A0A1A8TFQ4_9GAMM|nr:dienelactone hydrolase family protein [Marinomonas aquimarina]SBS32216.1 Dienelactone hydrolase family protein [Marinomonas aquimarina]